MLVSLTRLASSRRSVSQAAAQKTAGEKIKKKKAWREEASSRRAFSLTITERLEEAIAGHTNMAVPYWVL